MILPLGFNTSIPNTYDGIKKRLKDLGLAPTGNPQVDRARLVKAIKEGEKEYKELKKEEKLEEEKKTSNLGPKSQKEQQLGAQLLAMEKRLYFGI